MHNADFEKYLNSKEYSLIEYDPAYIALRQLLIDNLQFDIFLDVEELLHEEIIFKMYYAFQAGFHCGTK